MPELNGALVIEVVGNSPASRGGIQACDLIREVNGTKVQDTSQVQLAVDRGRVGQVMSIVVERDGETVELTVTPEELPRQQ